MNKFLSARCLQGYLSAIRLNHHFFSSVLFLTFTHFSCFSFCFVLFWFLKLINSGSEIKISKGPAASKRQKFLLMTLCCHGKAVLEVMGHTKCKGEACC